MELKRILENYLFGSIKVKNWFSFYCREFLTLPEKAFWNSGRGAFENDVSVCFRIDATRSPQLWFYLYSLLGVPVNSVVHFTFTRGTYASAWGDSVRHEKCFFFLLQKSYLQWDQGDWNHCKELRKSRFILCFHLPGAGIHIHRSKQNGLDATIYDATMSRGNLFYGNSRMRGMPPG